MKAHQEVEEKQEKMHEQRMIKQEEQLKKQEKYLELQEQREERFMSLMQQMLMMMPTVQPQMPIQPQMPLHSMYSLPTPSAQQPQDTLTPAPFPGYLPYSLQDSSMENPAALQDSTELYAQLTSEVLHMLSN